MGSEALVTARFNGRTASGKARLETDVLHFRGGDMRLAISFKAMSKVAARDGTLSVRFPDGTASFELGAAAAKGADKIQHPPSRLAKNGVKPPGRAPGVGVAGEAFPPE